MSEVRERPIRSAVPRVVIGALDALLLVGWGWSLLILATGGWEWSSRFGVVRARTASSVIYVSAALTCLRVMLARGPAAGPSHPGLLPAGSLVRLFTRWSQLVRARWTPATTRRLLAGIVVASTLARLLNAWHYSGFCCGDDVEIHEMTFSRLFGMSWPIWNIRTAIYPMLFVYPLQAAAVRAGITDAGALVFVGRLVPVAFAAGSIWLTFHLARRQAASEAIAVAAATVIAVNKIFGNYGSSELPGTVAAAFVVAAALLLLRGGFLTLLLASFFVGLAASFRFSELVFVPAGFISLCATRRWARAAAFGVLSVACFLLVVGASDLVFWDRPLSSLVHVVDFTLVQRLSSRGYQPFHYYLSAAPTWADWLLLVFIVYGAWRAPLSVTAWFLVPVAALSCLPHKEARYLVPAMPFASILAAWGFWSLLTAPPRRLAAKVGEPMWQCLVVAALATALLLEADGFRFRRSEAAVRAVASIAARERVNVAALEQSWVAGGRLFLMKTPAVLELPEQALASAEAFDGFLSAQRVELVGLTQATLRQRGYDRLLRERGFTEAEQDSLRPSYRVFWKPAVRRDR